MQRTTRRHQPDQTALGAEAHRCFLHVVNRFNDLHETEY